MRYAPHRLLALCLAAACVVAFGASAAGAGNTGKSAGCSANGKAQSACPNLWVAPTGKDGTCARADSAKPCGSLIRAYQLARCGDLVLVENGAYAGQTLGHSGSGQDTDAKNCSSSRSPIRFRGETQSGVSFGGLTIAEPWVALSNVTTPGLSIQGWDSSVGCYTTPVTNVTVSGLVIDAKGAQVNPMFMASVQHVTLIGNSIGNVTTGETEISNPAGFNGAPCPHNNYLTFERNTWHDFLNPNGSADHMECLQFDALTPGTSNDNVVLRGNRFLNCGQYDLFISGRMTAWTITGNYFDAPCSKQAGTGCVSAGGALSLSNNYSDVLGEFNEFAVGTYPQFSILDGDHENGVWRYNVNGSFPDRIHCGTQNGWAVYKNVDAGSAVCSADTTDVTRTRLFVVASSYRGRTLSAAYGVLSASPVHVRLIVYRGRRKLLDRIGAQRVATSTSPTTFVWRNTSTAVPTRVCVRTVPAAGASAVSSCSQIST